jgi:4-oxalomesaconate hydratase
MRILVVSAHVADFCSRAGGTLAKYAREGADVRVLCLSYGERSESGGLYSGGATPALEEVKTIRRGDAERAAGILGVEPVFLDWGDLLFEYTQERALVLADELRAHAPDLVLTHHGPDPKSVDHDSTWQLVRRALQIAGAPGLESRHPTLRGAELFLFEATVPLTELEGFAPDVYVDISDTFETKMAALREFGPAQGFLVQWYTDVALRRAFQAQRLSGDAGIVYAEAFERTAPWVGRRLPTHGL